MGALCRDRTSEVPSEVLLLHGEIWMCVTWGHAPVGGSRMRGYWGLVIGPSLLGPQVLVLVKTLGAGQPHTPAGQPEAAARSA